MKDLVIRFVSILMILLLNVVANADPRQVYQGDKPEVFQAIGQLYIPAQKYQQGEVLSYREYCTATLISEDFILTAWHCLEYYADLSREITFTLPYGTEPIIRQARPVLDGGGMEADWAVLELSKAIPKILVKPMALAQKPGTKSSLTLAGYSRDAGLGAGGKVLSYHTGCRELYDEGYRVATNCLAFKGASGGPVIDQNLIIGVLSEGDSTRVSYFIPASVLARRVAAYTH